MSLYPGLPDAPLTPPAVEPLGLAEAKDHLRVTSATEDALIDADIIAARWRMEKYLGRALVTQTWEWYLDRFRSVFRVPMPALQSVTSIKYFDGDGVEQTLAASVYQVDTKHTPGRIAEAYGETWPATRDQFNAVKITFVAGYGDAASDVPAPLRSALLLDVGHLFRNREATVDREHMTLPLGYAALAAPFIAYRF
ncbi:MAG TPA: hypothetical protein VGA50_04590 [Kiloniellales bacterium]